MELQPTDDVATLQGKLCISINETIKLTEQLKEYGGILNSAKVEVLRSNTKEEKQLAKIKEQEAEGSFAEIKALIKLQKEITNGLKTLLKAEHLSGGF
uniref:Uncharacterized protein n=1 Tax=viral metagenome TaxID=1070528 RepID=A0A6M3LMN0_9ZZZZ